MERETTKAELEYKVANRDMQIRDLQRRLDQKIVENWHTWLCLGVLSIIFFVYVMLN